MVNGSNVIIVHGMPSEEEYRDPSQTSLTDKHWFSWLKEQFRLKGIVAQTPEFPIPYRPNYDRWLETFEEYPIDETTILVGHSCGAGFLVRYLSENKVRVGRVALVAPWINPKDSRVEPGFFDFKMDSNLASRTGRIALFISNDDDREILDTAEMLKNQIKNIQVKEFTNKGHFTLGEMRTEEFPELLDFLVP